MNKRRSLGTSSTGYSSTFEPTGTLAFEILEYMDSAQKLWQDKMHVLIETWVSAIIAGLMKAAGLLRRRTDERKKREMLAQQRQLQLQELAKRVNQEEERVKKRISDSRNCKFAKAIREYLSKLATCDPAVVAEAKSRLRTIPGDELLRCKPVVSPPMRRTEAVEYGRFCEIQIWKLQNELAARWPSVTFVHISGLHAAGMHEIDLLVELCLEKCPGDFELTRYL